MAENGVTPLLLAAEVMLVSLALCAVLLVLLHRSRKQLKQYTRKQIPDTAAPTAEHFLQREWQVCRRLRREPGPLRRLSALRAHWLQAELRALTRQGEQPSDMHQLEQDLARLLARLGPSPSPSPATSPATRADSGGIDLELSRTRDMIAAQRRTIEGLRELLELYRKRSGADPEAAAAAERKLGAVEEGTDQFRQTIDTLEQELNRLRENQRLAGLEIDRLRAGHGTPAEAQRLVAEMAAAFNDSGRELRRLQEVNQRQRGLILQLEQEVTALRQDDSIKEGGRELLDKLKLQLRDYEMCTTMLEQETERLRDRVATLSVAVAQLPRDTPAASAVNVEIQQLIALLAVLAQATSLEQAGAGIIEFFRGLRVKAVLMLKAAPQPLWLSTEGAVDRRDKQLLQGTQADLKQPWLESGDDSLLLYPCCRLLLRASAADRAALRGPLSAAGPALHAMLERFSGAAPTATQLQELGERLRELEEQGRHLTEESRKVTAGFHAELETLLVSATLTDLQRQCIAEVMRDARTRLEVLDKAAAVTHRTLLLAIEQLDGFRRGG